MYGIDDLTDGVTRRIEQLSAGVTGVFDPVIRLGVTGLSRAGKTVFITSLVANLMNRGRMPGFTSGARITAAFLQPQPDDTVPRFEYETHLAALTGPEPHWPQSTRAVSQLRLSLKVQGAGMLGALSGPSTVHLDIIDYPGEWLLDLSLMDKSYAEWSRDTLERISGRETAQEFVTSVNSDTGQEAFDEMRAQELTQLYTGHLRKARAQGMSDCTPGRFLMPGDLEGAPVLTFVPLPETEKPGRKSLWREMERRFEAYKRQVVRPFFRDHFAQIDRQVVLVDALGAIHAGPEAVEDMRRIMTEILVAFRPGQNGFLSRLLRGRRVDKILFAATKADHLHHHQHARLGRFMDELLSSVRDRAKFAGAETAAIALASLRSTVEETRKHEGEVLDCVRGTRLDGGGQAAFYPGELPEDPSVLLTPARQGKSCWLDAEYEIMSFAPSILTLKLGDGPPHIRLDRAAQFLLGDRI